MYTTFNSKRNDALKEPMFFGNNVNVSRYDQQKYAIFEKLTEKQLSFFWRPEEIDVSRDRIDFKKFSESERHIFLSNIKYQTLLDSVQGRSPNIALLPIVSLPEVETWIETWSFSETIHSRSYTHILRALLNDPSIVFNDVVDNIEIQKRAVNVSKYYDDLILATQVYHAMGEGVHTLADGRKCWVSLRELKKMLYLCLNSINALEGIRFYVSFACTFAFCERNLIDGCGRIMRLIARDEALHLTGTQQMINFMQSGEDDYEMMIIAQECKDEARQIFLDAAQQEKDWASYLFKDGSMIGLNKDILSDYVDHLTQIRLNAINLSDSNDMKLPLSNPLPWMNAYLRSDNVQVAPQEAEIGSYLVGQVDSDVSTADFESFDL